VLLLTPQPLTSGRLVANHRTSGAELDGYHQQSGSVGAVIPAKLVPAKAGAGIQLSPGGLHSRLRALPLSTDFPLRGSDCLKKSWIFSNGVTPAGTVLRMEEARFRRMARVTGGLHVALAFQDVVAGRCTGRKRCLCHPGTSKKIAK
jgi:hypothetical protein